MTTSDRPPNVPQLRCVKRDYLRHFQNEFAVGTELWSDGGASLSLSHWRPPLTPLYLRSHPRPS